MATAPGEDRNQEATCYVGDLDQQVSESLLSAELSTVVEGS